VPIIFLGIVGLVAILAVTTYRVRHSRIAAAVLLLAVAALTGATAFLGFGQWDAVPLVEALSEPGQAGHREFRVSVRGPYEVVIAVERLEGRDSPFGGRYRHSSPVNLDWQVTAGESEIAAGNSRTAARVHVGGASTVGQIIGHFEAKPRTVYTLAYSVGELAPELLDYHPALRIQSNNRREPFHSRAYLHPTLFWAGVVNGILGLAMLAAAVRGRPAGAETGDPR
jgi:hypothetical protein